MGHTLKVRNGDETAGHFRSAAHGRLPRDRREPCTETAPLCGPGPRVLLPVTAFFRFGPILSPFLPAVKGWGGKKAWFWVLFRLYRDEYHLPAPPSGQKQLYVLHGETGVEGQVDAEADDLGHVLDPLVNVPGGDHEAPAHPTEGGGVQVVPANLL